MSLAKILSIVGTGICCLALFVLGSFMLDEGYNPVIPDVDTKYAPDYEEIKFNSVTIGMDTADVIKLIGVPFGKRGSSTQMWHYSADGKCTWADFAWLDCNLVIDGKGKVKEINNNLKRYY